MTPVGRMRERAHLFDDGAVKIRLARQSDLEAITAIYNEAIETTTATFRYRALDNRRTSPMVPRAPGTLSRSSSRK